MREPKKKNKATRVLNGGIHVYIPKDKLELALKASGIPTDTKDLEVQVFPGRGGKGRAMLMLRVKTSQARESSKQL